MVALPPPAPTICLVPPSHAALGLVIVSTGLFLPKATP